MTERSRKPYNPDDIVLARLDETDLSNVANFNCRRISKNLQQSKIPCKEDAGLDITSH